MTTELFITFVFPKKKLRKREKNSGKAIGTGQEARKSIKISVESLL